MASSGTTDAGVAGGDGNGRLQHHAVRLSRHRLSRLSPAGKDRMDITGARWGLEGAEAILKLRAVIATGDFDAYWRFHLRREHERIHGALYRESLVLAA